MISRGLVMAIVMGLAALFSIVATAMSVNTCDGMCPPGLEVKSSWWRMCTYANGEKVTCTSLIDLAVPECKHRPRTVQAFSILAIITSLVPIGFGVMGHLRKLPEKLRGTHKIAATCICAIPSTWCLLTWASVVYFEHHACGALPGDGNTVDGKTYGNTIVAIIAWLISVVAVILSSPMVLPSQLTDWEQAIVGSDVQVLVD